MRSHADKSPNTHSNAVANRKPDPVKKGVSGTRFQDNRSAFSAQRKLQNDLPGIPTPGQPEIADQSARNMPQTAVQKTTDRLPSTPTRNNNGSLPIQRTIEEAIAYYNNVTNSSAQTEHEVDLNKMSGGQKGWYTKLRNSNKRKRRDSLSQDLENKKQKSQKTKEDDGTATVGIVTWNIAHFGKDKKNPGKNENKALAIVNMFKNNAWLDIMVLQEINNLDYFREVLNKFTNELEVITSTQQLAVLRKTGGAGQREDYPIIIRKNSGWKITRTDSYYPMEDGGVWVDQDQEGEQPSSEKVQQEGWKPKMTKKEAQKPPELSKEELKDVKSLDEEIGMEEDLDYGSENKLVKWLKNHELHDTWRDWGGDEELSEKVDEGNEAILDFLKSIRKTNVSKTVETFIATIPSRRNKKNKLNDSYYKQLHPWIKGVLTWLKAQYKSAKVPFDATITNLKNHLHNVAQVLTNEATEDSSYRPIRRYYISNDRKDKDLTLVMNVVHTSPSTEGKSGDGKSRKKVYQQVSPVLEEMTETKNPNEIMIGDVYINPTDTVENKEKIEDVFEKMNLTIAGGTRADTNLWTGKGMKVYNQADIIVTHKSTETLGSGIVKIDDGGLEPKDVNHREVDKWTRPQKKNKKALSDHAPVGVKLKLTKGKHDALKSYQTPNEESLKWAAKQPFWQNLTGFQPQSGTNNLPPQKPFGSTSGSLQKPPGNDKGKNNTPSRGNFKPPGQQQILQLPQNLVPTRQLKSYLTSISNQWNQGFIDPLLQNNSGTGNTNSQGFMANQVKSNILKDNTPLFFTANKENELLQKHGLHLAPNMGKGAWCFIYSIIMGMTGLSEKQATPIVNEVVRQAKISGGWIAADSGTAAMVIGIIESMFKTQIDVVVVSHGNDGTIISGRSGSAGGHTVVIRQTIGHFDAYVPD